MAFSGAGVIRDVTASSIWSKSLNNGTVTMFNIVTSNTSRKVKLFNIADMPDSFFSSDAISPTPFVFLRGILHLLLPSVVVYGWGEI
jgi:hypothetical protein